MKLSNGYRINFTFQYVLHEPNSTILNYAKSSSETLSNRILVSPEARVDTVNVSPKPINLEEENKYLHIRKNKIKSLLLSLPIIPSQSLPMTKTSITKMPLSLMEAQSTANTMINNEIAMLC